MENVLILSFFVFVKDDRITILLLEEIKLLNWIMNMNHQIHIKATFEMEAIEKFELYLTASPKKTQRLSKISSIPFQLF